MFQSESYQVNIILIILDFFILIAGHLVQLCCSLKGENKQNVNKNKINNNVKGAYLEQYLNFALKKKQDKTKAGQKVRYSLSVA